MRLCAEAFAKVNLELHVLSSRPDGYHELDTVFQSIDLADSIEMWPGRGSIRISCDDPDLPVDDGNLVCRAGMNLARRFGVAPSADVRLTKRVPVGAGLGGGSSDAAVALGLFARLWSLPLDLETEQALAAEIGSDVPFFLHGGKARGRGRGELIAELTDGPEEEVLLVVPPFSISTARVYERWRRPTAALKPQEKGKESAAVRMFGQNDLAEAVLDVEPAMGTYWEALADSFPDCAISGSGSALVARLGPGDEARIEEFQALAPEAVLLRARTISRGEYRHRTTGRVQEEVAQS
jgi:4-diphosphocytidyl-2-C-methyl-D-erythritol kinase